MDAPRWALRSDKSAVSDLFGSDIIVGVDEVGRGPLAGPVVTAAVVLPTPIQGLADSKALSAKKREALFSEIMEKAHVGVGAASVREIDQLNILHATLLAMRRAVARVPARPTLAMVDGNQNPGLGFRTELVIKGDAKIPEISAASIVAKVIRDRLMARLARRYPFYAWESNVGYGAKAHRDAMESVGVTPHHRKSFAPLRLWLENETFDA